MSLKNATLVAIIGISIGLVFHALNLRALFVRKETIAGLVITVSLLVFFVTLYVNQRRGK
jgi:hypothetical protein